MIHLRKIYIWSRKFSNTTSQLVKNSHDSQEDNVAVSCSQQQESQTDASTDSYVDERTISDDSQPVETEDVFDFLTTTEGAYDIPNRSITKSWKVASGFNVSKSSLQYRKTCIQRATARQIWNHWKNGRLVA